MNTDEHNILTTVPVMGSTLPCDSSQVDGVLAPDPFIGRTIGSGYVIAELVGRGGMGKVYRARQAALDRDVAIKVLHPHLLADEPSVARFHREAKAASRLNHPNSVAVIDFGMAEGDVPYLVMEHLAGKSLRAFMHSCAPMPIRRAVWVGLEVLSALDEAHSLGVVHRDLKPENIFLVSKRDGTEVVKVVDFGLAHIAGGSEAHSTQSGVICGTPGYTAPERWLGEPVDGRTDLYSLGAVMFELISGQSPFRGGHAQQMVAQLTRPAPSLVNRFPVGGVSPALDEVIMKALARSPADRFPSAERMASALREALESLDGDAPDEHRCASCEGRDTDLEGDCITVSSVLISGTPPPDAEPSSSRLNELSRSAQGVPVVVLTGPPGAGKTSRLDRLAEEAAAAGDTVYRVSAHPSGVAVPYWPLRALALLVSGHDEAGLRALSEAAASFSKLTALERAGIAELLSPQGLRGVPGAGRAAAVAAALQGLLRTAAQPRTGRLVLLIDDADRCDALSLSALSQLAWFPVAAPDSPRLLVLAAEAASLLPAVGAAVHLALDPWRTAAKNKETVRALSRLGEPARAAAEAALVLGPNAPFDGVELLSGPLSEAILMELRPVLRRSAPRTLALSAVALLRLEEELPAWRSCQLHDRALEWAEHEGAPLELRAHHAARGSEPMAALVLLEQVGIRAVARGDAIAAVEALRSALEVARRALCRAGEDIYDDAILSFSEQLASALRMDGRASQAEGVLGEVMERARQAPERKARMLLTLGQLDASSGSQVRARSRFTLALSLKPDVTTEARVHLELGMLARASGELTQALSSLRAGERLLAEAAGPPDALARLRLALCSLLAQGDRTDLALRTAHDTLEALKGAGLPALEAEAQRLIGALASRLGRRAAAAKALREATRLSGEAGDVEGSHRWIEARFNP
jgi:serine/threonine protein kinase/tetratricopeptide (TPR) repeat protein